MTTWIVSKYNLNPDDRHYTPRTYVTDVPDGVSRDEVVRALAKNFLTREPAYRDHHLKNANDILPPGFNQMNNVYVLDTEDTALYEQADDAVTITWTDLLALEGPEPYLKAS